MRNGKTDSRSELFCLVKALKNHVILSAESKGGAGSFYLKGDVSSIEPEAGDDQAGSGTINSRQVTLEVIREELGDCKRCNLYKTRRHLVFGEGNPGADLVFVGEAPGEQEDIQGKPFVGRAGYLLTRIVEAMRLSREQVYICNILKCRPPGNRNPKPEEITVCEPFLVKQLQSIHPRVICALGTFAAQTLLRTKMPISQLRGKFHDYQGIKLMPTYHPAYLLRNPGGKKHVWSDIQMIMKEIGDGPQSF